MADYQVRYIPTYVEKAISGAKGKKFARPYLMDVRTFMIQPDQDTTICSTYVLFGGVPQPKMHKALVDAGFVLRRTKGSWKNKDGEDVAIDATDNSCWAVYYTTEAAMTKEQIKVVASFQGMFAKVASKQKSFLLPRWDMVDTSWKGRKEWLDLVVYKDDEEGAPVQKKTKKDDDVGLLSEDEFGDMDNVLI